MSKYEGNGWSKYEIFVLETLERLEEQIKDINNVYRSHTKADEEILAGIREEILKIKQDYKWHVRIFAGIWAVVVTAINIAISLRLVG